MKGVTDDRAASAPARPGLVGARPLISRKALALQLGCAVHTLACWHVKGFGPPVVKVGARAMYDPADVQAFIEDRKRSSTAEPLPSMAANG